MYPTDNLPYEKVGKNEPVCIADEVPFDIPETWEWARLGMISTYSHTKQKINAQNADPKMWVLDLEDIEKGGRLLEQKTVEERKAVGDKTFFDSGDILYSKLRPYLLKILVAPDCGICTPEIVPFKVFGKLDPEYVVAFLKCPYVDGVINSVTYGVKMPRVGTETMTELLVPIPPLSEQKRIVEKLNEVTPFTDSYAEAYVRAAELNQQFPDLLKKSILQEAVQGKLVPQDPDDEPASVLLERIRAEKEQLIKAGKIKRDKHESVIFRRDNSHYEKLDGIERCIDDEIPFDLPESWEWVRFFSVVDIATNLVRPEEYADYIHIAPDNIEKATGTLFECHTVQQDKVVSPNHLFYKGQIIYSKIRPLLRKAVIAPFDGLCSADMYPLNTAINRKYLLRYMLSDAFNLQVATAMSSRVKMPKINQDELSKILIPIPPMQEQERIVSKIEELFNKITLI
ncbi:restriction endonuclease subunit S [Flavonifractor plautii]|uniref:restriction endonuclease subunit S n=1 Tax=Flavonifractor plautii TaxID=292800 RepID=UPI001A9AE60E|nr:restriction endonuclease subunit S [Flavonifractor plautii]